MNNLDRLCLPGTLAAELYNFKKNAKQMKSPCNIIYYVSLLLPSFKMVDPNMDEILLHHMGLWPIFVKVGLQRMSTITSFFLGCGEHRNS